MSLYVRVLNNFYTHRKTLRLRAVIGEAAFWVPPRLWAYAAENQPDGCFKDYSGHEIASLIGYLGDAQALLEALLQAGFLDDEPIRIHAWAEHNAYHSTFADRAKKAAEARWGKDRKRKDKTVPEKTVPDLKGDKHCLNDDEAMLQAYHKDSRTALYWLNEKSGKHFRETATNLGFISERLKERDVDIEGIKTMINRQCKRWLGTKDAEYLRPQTLFNETKFDSYYASKDMPVHSENGNHPPERNQLQEQIEIKTL